MSGRCHLPGYFQFALNSPHVSNNGYITLNDKKIHLVTDVDQFYKALGYTDEIRKTGLLPEEFIWDAYKKDNRDKCGTCLQVKIIEYLSKHSEIYKDKYAADCQSLIENCRSKLNGDAECKVCNLRPNIIIK